VAQLVDLQGSSGLSTEAASSTELDALVSALGGDGAFGSGSTDGVEAVTGVDTALTGDSSVSGAADAGTVPVEAAGCVTDADCAPGENCLMAQCRANLFGRR